MKYLISMKSAGIEKKIFTLSAALLAFFAGVMASAQKVAFSGYGSTGLILYDRMYINGVNNEAYYKGKLQADADIGKNIEAQLDIRGESQDNVLKLHEFSIKYELSDRFYLKAGNIKKPFGFEQSVNREDLNTVERSFMQEKMSEIGYGGRNISLMAYGKKNENFPVSWYFSVMRDNSSSYGAAERVEYFTGDFVFGQSALFQKTGAEIVFYSYGLGVDCSFKNGFTDNYFEIIYAIDPIEGVRRKLINQTTGNALDENIYSLGSRLALTYEFPSEREFLYKIRPVFAAGCFVSDASVAGNHSFQFLFGADFFINKNSALRLNADLRLTKNEFSESYSTKESRVILEVQAKF